MLLNRRPHRKVRRIAVFALLAIITPQSWGWGREGHRLVGLVAEHYLTPAAREQVDMLLHGQSLAEVAPWADEYRLEHPETAPWHFVDIPSSAAEFNRDRDCPMPRNDPHSPWRDCVTDRILYFEGRLGDTSLPPAERAVALKFLVHLIGDIHQPFHAIGDARGGNDIHVTFLGQQQCDGRLCNLHGVWDDQLIEEQHLNERQFAGLLLQQIAENHWDRLAGGEPTTWANISHRYALNALPEPGGYISREYVAQATKIVDQQLALAGLRLAHVLNRILDDTPPADARRVPLPKPQAAPPAR